MSNTATENDYLSIGGGVNLFDDEARFILKTETNYKSLKILIFVLGEIQIQMMLFFLQVIMQLNKQ